MYPCGGGYKGCSCDNNRTKDGAKWNNSATGFL